ncbi:hypothetical protein CsSME_00045721 [Camellia sinensis var. sinensis]
MLSVREKIGPHRQILFLGGQSFEIEEMAETSRGHRCLSIVERGQGLRKEVRCETTMGVTEPWSSLVCGSIVVTSMGKITQTFLSMSDFGDGWEGVALVLEGFAKGDGWGVMEERWFDLLERALVGQVEEVGSRGVGFSAMVEWVPVGGSGSGEWRFV